MSEGALPAPVAAVTAWLASPADPARLAAIAAAGVVQAARIDQLPVAALAALLDPAAPAFRFRDARPSVRTLLLVAGLAHRCEAPVQPEEARDLDQMPFVLRVSGSEVIAEFAATALRSSAFGQPFYSQWAGGVAATAIVVDCHRLEHINSVMIAWLLQLVQAAKPTQLHIRRARPQVITQLKQLRLDHLMKIG